eukprot:c10432_g1_i1.p1 GENE.c10432_g1_i1~~c10432_g1_i1.p1  ORF type:complete len:487 (+),score=86.98 c10432_g1_i1:29-1489(+)
MTSEVHELCGHLASLAPGFAVDSDNIDFLQNGSEYYDALLGNIRTATQRIVLTSLYLGSSERERTLVSEIENAMVRSPGLRVTVLLDCMRGCRPSSPSGDSSVDLLRQLVESPHAAQRVDICLFQSHLLTPTLMKFLPTRFLEVPGVMHMKIAIFDNTVILSGANLSKDYFEDRQDRYTHFRNTSSLCNYFNDIVSTFCKYSFKLVPKATLAQQQKQSKQPPPRLAAYGMLQAPSPSPLTNPSQFKDSLFRELTVLSSPKRWSDTPTQTHTWVFPSIQAGSLNINQDEALTCTTLRWAGRHNGAVDLATAYFNISSAYMPLVLGSHAVFRLLTSSPRANGFYGARGIAAAVTPLYTRLQAQFVRRVETSKQSHERVRLFEWERGSSVFHAKGIWLSSPQMESSSAFATVVGSSNYGGRSINKDIEAQVTIITTHTGLKSKMTQEKQRLFSNATELTTAKIPTSDAHKLSLPMHVLTFLMQPFLSMF